MTSAACFISGGVAPGAALQALLEKEALSLASINLVCCEAEPAAQIRSPSVKYNVVLAASSSPHSRDALVRVARGMAPGGRLYVYEAAQPVATSSKTGDDSRVEALKHELLLSGFTDARVLDATGLSSCVVAGPSAWVFAQLPSWGLGASAKLSLKRPAAAAAPPPLPPPPVPAAGNVWKLAAGGDLGVDLLAVDISGGGVDVDVDEEFVDEDLLLTAEDKTVVPAPKPDDCEVGQSGRKACKNCSCGRAEAEAAVAAAGDGVKLTADMLGNPQSACGNCYLGDAFRCASCPYRGLPAFQPGEKITLAASMLAADV